MIGQDSLSNCPTKPPVDKHSENFTPTTKAAEILSFRLFFFFVFVLEGFHKPSNASAKMLLAAVQQPTEPAHLSQPTVSIFQFPDRRVCTHFRNWLQTFDVASPSASKITIPVSWFRHIHVLSNLILTVSLPPTSFLQYDAPRKLRRVYGWLLGLLRNHHGVAELVVSYNSCENDGDALAWIVGQHVRRLALRVGDEPLVDMDGRVALEVLKMYPVMYRRCQRVYRRTHGCQVVIPLQFLLMAQHPLLLCVCSQPLSVVCELVPQQHQALGFSCKLTDLERDDLVDSGQTEVVSGYRVATYSFDVRPCCVQ